MTSRQVELNELIAPLVVVFAPWTFANERSLRVDSLLGTLLRHRIGWTMIKIGKRTFTFYETCQFESRN